MSVFFPSGGYFGLCLRFGQDNGVGDFNRVGILGSMCVGRGNGVIGELFHWVGILGSICTFA